MVVKEGMPETSPNRAMAQTSKPDSYKIGGPPRKTEIHGVPYYGRPKLNSGCCLVEDDVCS